MGVSLWFEPVAHGNDGDPSLVDFRVSDVGLRPLFYVH